MHKDGYLHVSLYLTGRDRPWTTASVHVLVCLAFHGLRPANHEASHLNGNRLDNRPENLAWETKVDNMARRDYATTSVRGSALSQSKLTEAAVVKLRRRRAAGATYRELGEEFGVSLWTARHAANGTTWTHVPSG